MRPHLERTLTAGHIKGVNIVTPIDLCKDDYIVSTFRDPVKRTVSHFAWTLIDIDVFYKDPFNKGLGVYTEATVDNLMEWVELRKDFISNYQSKMLSYPMVHKRYGLGYDDELFSNFIPNKQETLNKIKHVNLLLRTEQGIEKNKEDLKNIIWDQFNIPSDKRISIKNKDAESHANKASLDLYSLLSDKQKEKIASINDIDMEIYETNSLFWKNGEI